MAFVEISLGDDDKSLAARFSLSVNDGEAEALAVASRRNLAILSDDVGALRLAGSSGIQIETTLQLMYVWSASQNEIVVAQALKDVARLGNYVPPRNHPLREWFDDGISS